MTFDKRPDTRRYSVISLDPPHWKTVVSFVDYFSAMHSVRDEWGASRRARMCDLKSIPKPEEIRDNVFKLTR